MRPTVYAVGLALERNPQVAEAIAEAGSDVVAHGWRWIDYAPIPEAEEREHIRRCIEVIARLTGKRPRAGTPGGPASTPGASWSSKAASSMTAMPMPMTCPSGPRWAGAIT